MRKWRSLQRRVFDVRKGEYRRTLFVALYFLFIMFANNILKPVSAGLFLNRFSEKDLPYLYLLIAGVGGVLAYLYTKVVVNTSLRTAVTAATLGSAACLVLFWTMIGTRSGTLLYVFSVFVSLVGIVFISQGWLIAANIFDSREAKRLYGLLGLGAILGAALGGSFTAFTARQVGTKNLLPVAALFLLLAYLSLHLTKSAHKVQASSAIVPQSRQDDESAVNFNFRDVLSAIARYRHLLVIVGIITITFSVEILVEYQFLAMARATYKGDRLTAFLGKFTGVYLSLTTLVLQSFFTTLVVRRFGVGRTLLIAPVTVGLGAASVLAAPGLLTAALTRIGEASNRYSINRTAIELLYLPLPAELKNRTKAFVDVFVDRLGRGVGAFLLLFLTAIGLTAPRYLSLVLLCLALGWALLALWARKEYLRTVEKRVQARRLDLESARVTVQDTETIRVLEEAARGENPRQITYALSLLSEAPGYDVGPLLTELAQSPLTAVRAKVYETAAKVSFPGLLKPALAEIRSGACQHDVAGDAVTYALAVAPNPEELAVEFVNHPSCATAEAAVRAIAARKELVESLLTHEWLTAAAQSPDEDRRALAAFSVGVRGDEGTGVLHDLLRDPSPRVGAAAIRAAGALQNRAYLSPLVGHLASPRLRSAAIEGLVAYGEKFAPTLGVLLRDPSTPIAVRRQIPRVVAGVQAQIAVDTLQACLGVDDLTVRTAVLKALYRLREEAPWLKYDRQLITHEIRREAVMYFHLYAALERFRHGRRDGRATALLARTLDDRLKQTLDRLFRLLGLRYPPSQIRAAYVAVTNRRQEEFAAALDFLENVLEQDVKEFVLPMIDGSPHLVDIGREEFGVDVPDLETAIRHHLRSGDGWLMACAIATAAELKLKALWGDISRAPDHAPPEVAEVARDAAAALA
ncbi:MAG: HEAT repeat domain-containing protein [Bryobacteraceae bacterium]|nr:HEAT repeat domain-containing protein [Bryobacteraceae bacterium]